MDYNLFRFVTTPLSLAAFLGIVWWAYKRSNQAAFDEAAQLPFQGEDTPAMTLEGEKHE